MPFDPVAILLAHNQQRDPARLALKYQAMEHNAFSFLRATNELFHARLPVDHSALQAPYTWICGDLHLENFGSFKGDNRLVYFDLNDFDETACAPAVWDMLRFLCSLRVAGDLLGWGETFIHDASAACWLAYARALADGSPRWLERKTAQGAIKRLLGNVAKRKRARFVTDRLAAAGAHKGPQLKIDGRRTMAATAREKHAVRAVLHRWADQLPQPEVQPGFFNVLDVAKRIAGTGSLGLLRYVLLVQGRASSAHDLDGLFLLDIKHQPGSCVQVYVKKPVQTDWNDAERVGKIQHWAQAASPAFLSSLQIQKKSCLIKELMPTQDRINLALLHRHPKKLYEALQSMAHLAAWAHLRAAGRCGADSIDLLSEYGAQHARAHSGMLRLAREMAQHNQRDWQSYCKAYAAGAFAKQTKISSM